MFLILTFPILTWGQYYAEWESETVDQFYEKYDLPYGTLDEYGNLISFVYLETDLDKGVYEVEIEDESGDLYHVINTDFYLKFVGYYGYAGYGDEGILVVQSSGYATFYKNPD